MKPGTRIGRYELLGEIGRGAMGAVYRARDTRLKREVAIKTIASTGSDVERDDLANRLEREAQVAATLNDPGIVAIYDVEQEGQVLYVVMELVEGESLAQRMACGPRFDPGQALRIATSVADALGVAHAAGIVHRDIKPANLLMTCDGKVKVSDFGIAKAIGEQVAMTRTGMLVGSPAYMAPEQVQGGALDGRADLFSLGIVLFEMLAGHRPFPADTVTALVYQILHSDPFEDWQNLSHLNADVVDFLRWALAKDRDRRVPLARTFAERARALAVREGNLDATFVPPPATHSRGATLPFDVPKAAVVAERTPQPARRGRAGAVLWASLACAAIAAVSTALMMTRENAASAPGQLPAATGATMTGQSAGSTVLPSFEAPPEATMADADSTPAFGSAPATVAASVAARPVDAASSTWNVPAAAPVAVAMNVPAVTPVPAAATPAPRAKPTDVSVAEANPAVPPVTGVTKPQIDASAFRSDMPQTLSPPSAAPSVEVARAGDFGKRYAAAGRPRAVLFWNRVVDDEVGAQFETMQHSRTVTERTAGAAAAEVRGVNGAAGAVTQGSIETRERDSHQSTRRIDGGARPRGVGVRDDWALESSYTAALQNAGVRLVDRNVAMRLMQAKGNVSSPSEQPLVEARALAQAADWVIEVVPAPDAKGELGLAFRISVTDTRSGAILVRTVSLGRSADTDRPRPFVAGERGFVRGRAEPSTMESVGKQLALDTLSALGQRL